MGLLEYSSNNSGGHWWLQDEDWENLERNGWTVHWFHNINTKHGKLFHEKSSNRFYSHSHQYDEDFKLISSKFEGQLYVGDAKATSAAKNFYSPEQGIDEWERITGKSASELGCFTCCGPPHYFSWTDGKRHEYFSPEPSGSHIPGIN